jgi:DNA modification methylase
MAVTILVGDCREKLRELPDRSVHMVMTSPPYFGLRNYDVDGQMGLEATPEEFIAVLVEVFEEVRRVLRDDGTLWLNIGDSYAGSGRGGYPGGKGTLQGTVTGQDNSREARELQKAGGLHGRAISNGSIGRDWVAAPDGLKQKDLIGIPWMLAFALRAAGWYLRQEIIWHKLNPLPESVRDRCTKSHEQIFLFAKSGKTTCWRHEDGRWLFDGVTPSPDYVWRHAETKKESVTPIAGEGWRRVNRWSGWDYYFDQNAIMERTSPLTNPRVARGRSDKHKWADGGPGSQTIAKKAPSGGRAVGVSPKSAPSGSGIRANESWHASTTEMVMMRNKRTVWSVPSDSFSEAHFATYPPALIEPCILAGCPKGGIVLDPFFGAGTTGLVAESLQRDCIGIELNPAYADIARRRIRADLGRVECALPEIIEHGPLFATEASRSLA